MNCELTNPFGYDSRGGDPNLNRPGKEQNLIESYLGQAVLTQSMDQILGKQSGEVAQAHIPSVSLQASSSSKCINRQQRQKYIPADYAPTPQTTHGNTFCTTKLLISMHATPKTWHSPVVSHTSNVQYRQT